MRIPVLAAIAALGLGGTVASADTVTYSYTGDLRTDANVTGCGGGCTLGAGNNDGDYAVWAAVVRDFHVGAASAMTAISFSYGGGTNGAGTAIPEGGLEPYLSLFDAGGNFLASTYFGVTCPAGANTNSVSGFCYDVLLDGGTLAPGDYHIAISAFENMSLAENPGGATLADGFTGLGNLWEGEDLHYAFDVFLDQPAAVPEPGGLSLLVLVPMVVYALRRKRQ